MRATMLQLNRWVDIEPVAGDPVLANGGVELGEYLERRARDPKRADRLTRARKKLGDAMAASPDQRGSLAALRLKAGLSQEALARRMNTQQPSIARWERAPGQMNHITSQKLAAALGVSAQEVSNAILAQCEASTPEENHETA